MRQVRIAVLAMAGACVLAFPAGASAGWQQPTSLSESMIAPRVGVDAGGRATATWVEYVAGNSKPVAADHLPGGDWPEDPAPLGPGAPIGDRDLAVNAAGAAVLVWSEAYGIRAAYRAAGGDWLPPETVAWGDGTYWQVRAAIDPAGEVAFAWQQNSAPSLAAVKVRRRSSGGVYDTIETLAPSPRGIDHRPDVAYAAPGEFVLAWSSQSSSGYDRLMTSSRAPGELAMSAPQELSTPGTAAQDISLAGNANGTVIATWHDIYTVRAARRTSAGWSAPAYLAGLHSAGSLADIGRAAVDRDGRATAVWSRYDGTGWSIDTSSSADGAWEFPARTLSTAAAGQAEPVVAGNPAGDVVAAWREGLGVPARIVATTRRAGQDWPGSAETLSSAGVEAHSLTAAIDTTALAVAAWVEGTGDQRAGKVAFSDGEAPSVGLYAPADGDQIIQDATVTAHYECDDDQELATCSGPVASGSDIATDVVGPATFAVTATDRAGNRTTVEHAYSVVGDPSQDKTAPTITITTPADGATYEAGEFVSADYSCDDEAGGTGVARCDGDLQPGDQLDTGTAGRRTFTVTAEDYAGNVRTREVAYEVSPDTTPPEIYLSSPYDEATYDIGDRVPASYWCDDAVDGYNAASCEGTIPDGDMIDTTTAHEATFTVTATDRAGNTRTVTHTYRVIDPTIDVTAPEISLQGPPQGGLYFVGDVAYASYSCRDVGWPSSGMASCTGTSASGLRLDTASAGARTFTVTASDNAGNEATKTHSYRVLDPVATGADGDGDGLLDTWETSGVDADGDGTIDLRLHEAPYNADPRHKDMYVETDYMACAAGGCRAGDTRSFAPADGALADVTAAFAAAPVGNPDGTTGIRLHAVLDEAVRADAVVRFYDPATTADVNFDEIKSGGPAPCDGAFGTPAERAAENCEDLLAAKRLVSRYAVFARRYAEGYWSSGIGELDGNDFLVTVGEWGDVSSLGGKRSVEAGTYMHELGHNLDLHHGGADSLNCKPNYLSVMSYSRQFANVDPQRALDYSPAALPTLVEGALDERAGIGGPAGHRALFGLAGVATGAAADGAIDWNGSGGAPQASVAADVNRISSTGCGGSGSTLAGHDDWRNLSYDFRRTRNFANGVRTPPPPEVTEEQAHETAETADLDRDGVRNLDDACPQDSVANDLDGDGISDGCDAASDAAIDILPGTSPNAIKLSSRQPIAVAILSRATFSAPERVDRSSLRFGRTGTEASGAGCLATTADVNKDGRRDLICAFSAAKTGLRPGDTVAILRGKTVDGAAFTGRDSVRVTK